MKDLRQYFSSEASKKLTNLNKNLQNADAFSDEERLELFRTLHTVKGSSQTFGFTSAGQLAHKLESLFSNIQNKKIFDENIKNLFVEGIELLINCLEEKYFQIPATFLEKINAVTPDTTKKQESPENLLSVLPAELLSQLANQEKSTLASALDSGKNLFSLEIGFDAASFAVEFKKLREILADAGEIIASLPSLKFEDAGKIGFRFVFVSSLQITQIKEIKQLGSAQEISDDSSRNFSNDLLSNDLQGVLAQIAEHGKTLAKKFGKEIEFEISNNEIELPAQKIKLIFDILTHLVRNAVDHAIEEKGKIEINLRIEKGELKLTISDDGRGIDLEKIKAKAIEKNLISADQTLNEKDTLDLIFLPEFSTASELTEISGRGIGLDAVKAAVEGADGKINVKSAPGKGTTFEISLPQANE